MCNTAAMTPILYRLRFGRSVAYDLQSNFERALVGLVYVSIKRSERPEFNEFLEMAREDPEFTATALQFLSAVYRTDPKVKPHDPVPGDTSDELDTLIYFAEANLPEILLHEASIVQLNYIISRHYYLKDPKRTRRMTNSEINRSYGITSEMETRIQEALEVQDV